MVRSTKVVIVKCGYFLLKKTGYGRMEFRLGTQTGYFVAIRTGAVLCKMTELEGGSTDD